MKSWLMAWLCWGAVVSPWSSVMAADGAVAAESAGGKERTVYVIPIREDIMPPLVFVVRRGVKEAMEAKADLLVLDMDTNGGRVDVTEEIIGIVSKFPGEVVTYVNPKAFSAGAFIAVATHRIVMAEEAVIGAAAPMMMIPGGGPAQLPETVEAKMTSGIKALIRAKAEKHGHNVEVLEAMIDRNKELIVDGNVINPKGQILTLTSSEAAREYGTPPKPLLSSGTFATLDAVLADLGFQGAKRVEITPTGAEKLAFWINAISPLLLALGLIGIYMEFKTPGFGVPGCIAVGALLLYFLGGYIAGLSGMEWVAVFALGVVLIVIELFVFPGTLALGVVGSLLVLVSIVMAATDLYPGMPMMPSLPALELPMRNLGLAALLTCGGVWGLGWFLPKSPAYRHLVSQGASGQVTDAVLAREQSGQMGRVGVALSVLRPGGKAQFGDAVLDVVSAGDWVEGGTQVRIVGHRAREAVVEPCAG